MCFFFIYNSDNGQGRTWSCRENHQHLILMKLPLSVLISQSGQKDLKTSIYPGLRASCPMTRKKTLRLIEDHLKPKHFYCFFLTDEELKVGTGLDWQCWAADKLFLFLLIWVDACNTFSPSIAWDILTLIIPGYLFQRSIVWREKKRFWRVCHTRLWLLFLDDSLQVSFETHSKDLHYSSEKHFNCWI